MSSKKYVSFNDEVPYKLKLADSFENNNSDGESDNKYSQTTATTSPHDSLDLQPLSPGSFAAATSPTSSKSSKSSTSGSGSNESGKNSIFSLTRKKKQRPMPKIQSSGVVNYGGIGIGQNSDSESESVASTISNDSNPQAGYALPFRIQSGHPNPHHATNNNNLDDDELSQRTPIPKAPPNPAINAILPSDFLRNRTHSETNLSDISDDDSIIKRQKREEENVGRLVHAAKQQQSFAQAWFSAGQAQNALPPIPPKKKIPSNAPPGLKTSIREKSSGPIDLDSGELWNNDEKKKNQGASSSSSSDDIENHSKLNLEIGSFNFLGTTHSAPTRKRANKRMIQFGVPDDEDLTTYYIENKCLDRIVCTIGDTRCTFLALIVVVVFLLLLVGGAVSAGIIITQQSQLVPSAEPSAAPTLSLQPSAVPTNLPTMTPSYLPTSKPSPTPSLQPTSQVSQPPTSRPTSQPSSQPTSQPSSQPTLQPSSNPTDFPTSQPTSQPSSSPQPSSAPSDQPTSCFSSTVYSKVGQRLEVDYGLEFPFADRFGYSVSISANGNIIAVSALFYPENGGSVHVYERSNNQGEGWQLKGQRIDNEIEFGSSLELSDDGLTLVVGKASFSGDDVTRVYRYDSGLDEWVQLGSDIIKSDSILAGSTVSISGNGLIIAIGDRGHNDDNGRVIVYKYNGTDWIIQGNPIEGKGEFGHSVSLSQNGNIVACGAPKDDFEVFSANGAGVVHIYKWNEGTSSWELLGQRLQSLNSSLLSGFGHSVSISDDEVNPRVAVGSPFTKTGSLLNSGEVAVWEYDGDFWSQIGSAMLGKPSSQQKFGLSVSIAGDGTHVAVGNPVGEHFEIDGEVRTYFWNGNIWDETEDPLRSGEWESGFGSAVDLSKDGTVLAVGASSIYFQGYAEVYESNVDCEL